MRGTAPRSFAVMTARTPGIASAALASTEATRPWAMGLRRMAACSMPSRFKSPTNWPRPRRNRGSSIRSTGLPIYRFVPIMACRPCDRRRALRAPLRRSGYSPCSGTNAGEGRADTVGVRIGLLGQQRVRRRQHPGGTEAALQGVMLAEGDLQRAQHFVARQALDGDDARIFSLHRQYQTGADRGAVDNDRARAAGAMLAAEMSSGQA